MKLFKVRQHFPRPHIPHEKIESVARQRLYVKEQGGQPFIIPAMVSHGGATPEGQREVLESSGITEAYTGAPIKSSLKVVTLPQDNLPNKVYMDKYAYEADGTIVINRVKVHTDYYGPLESGVMKMLVIGLGKHAQALEIHNYGTKGLKEYIPPTARQVLKYGNIRAGIAIAEKLTCSLLMNLAKRFPGSGLIRILSDTRKFRLNRSQNTQTL